MFTVADQHFLVQLTGYIMGFLFAGVILMYFLFRIFKSVEGGFFFLLGLIPPLFVRTKKIQQ